MNSRADDEDAGLDEDSPTTLNFLADLLVAQRELTTAVKGKEPATPKTKGASRTKGKGAVAPSSVVDPAVPLAEVGGPIVRDVGDPRQALLHHVEALAELDRVRTKGLKDAAKVFHASVEEVLGAYQAGLDSHVDTLKFLVGLWPPFFLGVLLTLLTARVRPVPPAPSPVGPVLLPAPMDHACALLERLFVRPDRWRFNPRLVPVVAPSFDARVSSGSGSESVSGSVSPTPSDLDALFFP